MLKNLPNHIEKFYELQRFDLDISTNMADSPKHTEISLSSNNDDPRRVTSFGSNLSLDDPRRIASFEKRDSLVMLDLED